MKKKCLFGLLILLLTSCGKLEDISLNNTIWVRDNGELTNNYIETIYFKENSNCLYTTQGNTLESYYLTFQLKGEEILFYKDEIIFMEGFIINNKTMSVKGIKPWSGYFIKK